MLPSLLLFFILLLHLSSSFCIFSFFFIFLSTIVVYMIVSIDRPHLPPVVPFRLSSPLFQCRHHSVHRLSRSCLFFGRSPAAGFSWPLFIGRSGCHPDIGYFWPPLLQSMLFFGKSGHSDCCDCVSLAASFRSSFSHILPAPSSYPAAAPSRYLAVHVYSALPTQCVSDCVRVRLRHLSRFRQLLRLPQSLFVWPLPLLQSAPLLPLFRPLFRPRSCHSSVTIRPPTASNTLRPSPSLCPMLSVVFQSILLGSPEVSSSLSRPLSGCWWFSTRYIVVIPFIPIMFSIVF